MDKWDRKTNFNCDSCMFYVPKTGNPGRCRRLAPTMKGFPVVYGNAGWCGEHKIGSNPVRDGKEKPQNGRIRSCPKHTHTMYSDCPHCQCDIEKVFGKMHWLEEKHLTKEIENKSIEDAIEMDGTDVKFQIGMDPEEKAKIKAEIGRCLLNIKENTVNPKVESRRIITTRESVSIKELLEKL